MITNDPTVILSRSENKFDDAPGSLPPGTWYIELLEQAGIGLWLINESGQTMYVNQAMAAKLGYSRADVMALPLITFTGGEACNEGVLRFNLGRQGTAEHYESRLRGRDGEEITVSVTTVPIFSNKGEFIGSANAVKDIDDARQSERALRESEEQYRLLFEHGFAGIARSTTDGKVLACNEAMAHIFGCDSREEFIQMGMSDFYFDPGDRQRMIEQLEQHSSLRNYERRMRRKDGSVVWTLTNVTLNRRGKDNESVLEGVVLDITERKMIEQQLAQSHEQLRALSARIETVREEERMRISREIHDNLGQVLTGLKLDFSWLEKRLSRTSDESLLKKAGPKLREIAELLEETILTVRDIATELRPGVLDTLGLRAAIDWQAREFERRSGVKCKLKLCPEPPGLSAQSATVLFRIFQEILTNIARHSQAKLVKIEMSESKGEMLFKVQDNGVGITEEQCRSPKSLGILGMRERALIFGGQVVIKGEPGQGTTVKIRLPISR